MGVRSPHLTERRNTCPPRTLARRQVPSRLPAPHLSRQPALTWATAWARSGSYRTAHASLPQGPPPAAVLKPALPRESSVQLRRSRRSHTLLQYSLNKPRGRSLCSTTLTTTALVNVPPHELFRRCSPILPQCAIRQTVNILIPQCDISVPYPILQ